MDAILEIARAPFGTCPISVPGSADIPEGYGIVEFLSDNWFDKSVQRLKAEAVSQDTTLWFGELASTAVPHRSGQNGVNAEAVDLRRVKTKRFRDKKPPQIGTGRVLSKGAGQENPDSGVSYSYNGISAMAMLHHGDVIKSTKCFTNGLGRNSAAESSKGFARKPASSASRPTRRMNTANAP